MNRSPTPPGHRARKPVKDFTGVRVGSMVVLHLVERDTVYQRHTLRFLCDCGKQTNSTLWHVKMRKRQDCGRCQ